MFSLFKKKPVQSFRNFSFLGTDIHSHAIPGIDDGARDTEQAVALIEGLMDLGFDRIITTPHVMAGHYPNTKETISGGGDQLKVILNDKQIPLDFFYSAEYCVDENFETLLKKKDLILFPKEHLLIELTFISPPPGFEETIFKLTMEGITPILAHPERYPFWSQQLTYFNRLKDMGCKLQLNLLSIIGGYGDIVKKTALKMLEKKLFDFAGTDAHHLHHIEQLKEGLKEGLFYPLNEYSFKNKKVFGQ